MGYNTYTTSDLVENILLIGHVPLGNNTFTTSNIINLANRELQTPILKQILSTRGGYYLTYQDYTSTQSGLYGIPTDAIAGVLENIELIVGSNIIIPVNPVEESEQYSTNCPTSTSYGYFLKGNFVQILPVPTETGSPRFWYSKRPSTLIPTSSACQITAVNGMVLSVSAIPSSITVGQTVDLLGDQPPFNILNESIEITNITGTDITVDTLPDATVGDWLALHSQTPVPQIPVEFRPLLEQRVVCKIYELQGYLDKLKAAMESLQELEAATFNLITPRVKNKTKVINPIQGGFMNARRAYYPAAP